jgi:predicted dithiol-disulfide oxidoreductase (DUF899 family)
MYGPNWDNPCPSCTSLVDGFDRTWYQVTQDAAFVAIAKAPPIESMRGPNNVDVTLPIKPITNARETPMICNGQ